MSIFDSPDTAEKKAVEELIVKARTAGPDLDIDEIETLLQIEDPDLLSQLYASADEVRRIEAGDGIHLRGLLEFSNYCRCNCMYCGLRRDNEKLDRYRMSPDQILAVVEKIAERDVKTVVLQSGEDPEFTTDVLCDVVHQIKSCFDVAVTLSVGILPKSDLIQLKEAGADRYLLRHETADKILYDSLHPDTTLKQRVKVLEYLGELGYDVGTGPMVGLPGQTYYALAKDIDLARNTGADMFGVGPFIPHSDTPLTNETSGSAEDTYKMIAVSRLVLRKVHIPVTTALATLDKDAREKAWKLGANVVMPIATPHPYKGQYALYEDKRCLEDSLDTCMMCLRMRIMSVNRHIHPGYGHSLRKEPEHA